MTLFILAVIVCVFIVHHEVKPKSRPHGAMVSRSRSMTPRPDTYFCGNCHGTGDEGLGIMPDSQGPCEACGGRGYIKVDPNRKSMTLEEAVAFAERAAGDK